MAMRSISQILVLAVVLLPLRTYIDAAVQQLINYQGSLTDTNGAPLPDTTINIIFSIYRNDSIVAWTS